MNNSSVLILSTAANIFRFSICAPTMTDNILLELVVKHEASTAFALLIVVTGGF
jgi:hypothetical protein